MRAYEPVYQLAAREAVRFVGTVGDVVADICPLYFAVIEAFAGREVRTEVELIAAIQSHRVLTGKNACSNGVAKHTLEVAANISLLELMPFGSGRNRKYGLGRGGRVLAGMRKHPKWSNEFALLALRRPLFEFNGDYLLQALSTIDDGGDRPYQLQNFANKVRELTKAKLGELPAARSGLSWDTYVQELEQRQWWVGSSTPAIQKGAPNLASLKLARQKRAAEYLGRNETNLPDGESKSESKTFEHHFSRCRSWLTELGLVVKFNHDDRLTSEARRLTKYFKEVNRQSGPLRIPPTASLLKDAFRLPDETIIEAWGVLVDEEYWETGLFNLQTFGTYAPTEPEFFEAFAWAFEKVRFQRISEAPIQALREVLFLIFLLNQKPLRSRQLTDLIDNLLKS